jgi:hypothetical protein
MHDLRAIDPYDVIRQPLPPAGDERLAALLAWAVLSPSPHNTQPWRWRVSDGIVELRCDRSRLLEVSDPFGRELVIGCGSALEHLLLRLSLEGGPVRVELAADRDDPDLLARVITGAGTITPPRPDLVAAMAERRTNRTAYRGPPLDEPGRAALAEACAGFGVTLHWMLTPAARERIVELVMAADRAQMASAAFRRELSDWMRPPHSRRGDGMQADLLGASGIAGYVAPLVVRTFDVGSMQAARDGTLLAGSPDIVVISSQRDDRPGWLATGRALARLTLAARAAGRASAYMNQPCEVPEFRGQLAVLLGDDTHPQLVVRLGLADPVHRASRLPLGEVLN